MLKSTAQHLTSVISGMALAGHTIWINDRKFQRRSKALHKLKKWENFNRILKCYGLGDMPSRIFNGQVSLIYKIYTGILCMFCVTNSVLCLNFCLRPSVVPNWYLPLKHGRAKIITRWGLPLFHLGATTSRIAFCSVLNSSWFSRRFRECYSAIVDDPYLRQHSIGKAQQVITYIGPVIMGFVATGGLTVIWYFSNTLFFCLPQTLSFYCDLICSNTAALYGSMYCAGVSLNTIVPLLRITTSLFQKAIETEDIVLLNAAITGHDRCVRLIRCMDSVMSYVVGINLSVIVPMFAVVLSTTSLYIHNIEDVITSIGWVMFIGTSFVLVAYSSSAVNSAAHAPDHILSGFVPVDSEFQRRMTAFRARFTHRSIGYTYFGFTTVTKMTILKVFNLASTYLIVALQFNLGSSDTNSGSSNKGHSHS